MSQKLQWNQHFWKFTNWKLTNYTNFTNTESPFECTFSNNISNISMPKVHVDEVFTVVNLVKLVNSNFQKRMV